MYLFSIWVIIHRQLFQERTASLSVSEDLRKCVDFCKNTFVASMLPQAVYWMLFVVWLDLNVRPHTVARLPQNRRLLTRTALLPKDTPADPQYGEGGNP